MNDSYSSVFHERDDWTLYRTLEGLQQVTGVGTGQFLKLAAKELTDNALDASPSCRVGLLEDNGFYIEDDGDGIPGNDEAIAYLFSIKRPLRSTKLYRMPSRGALGMGLKFVTGLVLAAEGTLKVMTRARSLQLFPQYETGKTHFKRLGNDYTAGTRIEISIPGYKTDNILEWSKKAIQLNTRTVYKGKTSPHWYTFAAFYELIKSAPDDLTIVRFLESFDGCTGNKKWQINREFPVRHVRQLTMNNALELLRKMQQLTKPVRPGRLGSVGGLSDFDGYYKIDGETHIKADKKNISTIIPYVAEIWIRDSEKPEANIFVNRTHTATDTFPYINSKELCISDCGILCYIPAKSPKEIWINIITPYFPMMSGSKKPDFHYMKDRICFAAQKAAKLLEKSHRKTHKVKRKSQKSVVLENLTTAINKASDNLKYRYSLRQLYYVSRGIVEEVLGRNLKYGNFQSIITDYENETGEDLPNIYRDDRGSVYHPHLKETIRLGTLSVENYRKPEWIFNKILYCEKEGFIEILRSAQWAEKNDCLLLTSKGYATRAARDILDILTESDEELLFFCIHDADTDGTLIYQSLVDETKARPRRKVKVIELGLLPEEGMEMDLQIEKVQRKKNKEVSKYVPSHWKKWYRSNRIELNAMDTPTFIDWLDRKIEEFAKGKLIPPKNIMIVEFQNCAHSRLKNEIKNELLKEARIEERTDERADRLFPELKEKFSPVEIKSAVTKKLDENPYLLWKEPVQDLADMVVQDILGKNDE